MPVIASKLDKMFWLIETVYCEKAVKVVFLTGSELVSIETKASPLEMSIFIAIYCNYFIIFFSIAMKIFGPRCI